LCAGVTTGILLDNARTSLSPGISQLFERAEVWVRDRMGGGPPPGLWPAHCEAETTGWTDQRDWVLV